jgi:hypothetical protein
VTNEQREIKRKKKVIEYAERTGNVRQAWKTFGFRSLQANHHPQSNCESSQVP